MSTDVYIDFNMWPRPKLTHPHRQNLVVFRAKEHCWWENSDTIRIGYLYTMTEILIPTMNLSLLDYLRDLRPKYPIFNNVALAELRGVLRLFDQHMAEENRHFDRTKHGLDKETFNDYLTEKDAIHMADDVLGKYWYTRVD